MRLALDLRGIGEQRRPFLAEVPMLTRRHFVASILALPAASCGAPRQPIFALQKTVQIERDPRHHNTSIVGIEERHDVPYLGIFENRYKLRSWILDKYPVKIHQVYVEHLYHGGEIGWNSAEDETGASIKFTQIQYTVSACDFTGCGFNETFGCTVEDRFMRDRADRGFSVVFGSRRGLTKHLFLSPAQIRAQLDAYDPLWSARWGQAGSDAENRQRDRQPAKTRK